MHLSLATAILAASGAFAFPSIIDKRDTGALNGLSTRQVTDVAACIPLSKLRTQLESFAAQSARVLLVARLDAYAAQGEAQHAVDAILSPIDLLAPQVQGTQDTILADLAIVGSWFKQIAGTTDPAVQILLATDIQQVLNDRLWFNAIAITYEVGAIQNCASGAKN